MEALDLYLPSKGDVRTLSQAIRRPIDDVERDLLALQVLQRDTVHALNSLYVVDSWLHHELVPYQIRGIERARLPAPRKCEIWPRGHLKTTLFSRALPSLDAALGAQRYQVIASASEDNYLGNLEAIWQVFTGEDFEPIQYFLPYVHGPDAQPKRAGHEITIGRSLIEFRSLLGEMRGLNRTGHGGRPSRFIGDDILPTEAMESVTVRDRITRRFMSMVLPLGKKGSEIWVNGTIMDPGDLLSLIADNKIEGFQVTPPSDRRAYDPDTHEVLFPERWTYDALMRERRSYEKTGLIHLFRREYLNDPQSPESNPLSGRRLKRYERHSILPSELFRVLWIDHAHGAGGDKFVVLETGMDPFGSLYLLGRQVSRKWTIEQRYEAVYQALRRRRPHVLGCEDTSESRSFIDTLLTYLRERGMAMEIERPSGASKGSKNLFIQSWLAPMWDDGQSRIYVPDTDEGQIWATAIEAELDGFSIERKDNQDDEIETLAFCVSRSRRPVKSDRKIWKTGDKLADEVMAAIHKDSEKRRRRHRVTRSGRRPSLRRWVAR